MTYEKLTKEWKKKGFFFLGKALYNNKDFDEAIVALTSALQLVESDPSYKENASDISTLISEVKQKRALSLKKEKDTWSKAFKKNKQEGIEEEAFANAAMAAVATGSYARGGSSNGNGAASPLGGGGGGGGGVGGGSISPLRLVDPKALKGLDGGSVFGDSSSKNGVGIGGAGGSSSKKRGGGDSISTSTRKVGNSSNKDSEASCEEDTEDDVAGRYVMGGVIALLGLGSLSLFLSTTSSLPVREFLHRVFKNTFGISITGLLLGGRRSSSFRC